MLRSQKAKRDLSTRNFLSTESNNPTPLLHQLGLRACSRLFAAILFLCAFQTAKLQAQLGYDHTSFLNGYGSDSTIWLRSYADLQTTPSQYLGQSVVLKTLGYPDVPVSLRYPGQVGHVVAYLGQGGTHVLLAHSLGSLVARGAYIDSTRIRPDVAAIVALTPPHQGVPIADNFGTLRNYLRDMQRRISDAVSGFNVASIIYDIIFVAFAPKHIAGFGPSLFGVILYAVNSVSIDLNNIDQFGGAPALADLSPTSPVINHLNTRFDDSSIPRANIYGTIPSRNAALRLLQSMSDDDAGFDHMVTLRNLAQEFFSTCKWAGYVTVINWTSGRRCAYARKTLGRLDERWALYINGPDGYGHVRYIPFDGIVPNERSVYPTTTGLAYQGVAPMTNHINVYKTRTGLDQAANGMLRVGMEPIQGPPPPPTISVAISGSTSPTIGCPDVWFAEATGGVAPYTYQWTVNGAPYQTYGSSELEYTPTGPRLYLTATATDANGNSGVSSTFSARPVSGSC